MKENVTKRARPLLTRLKYTGGVDRIIRYKDMLFLCLVIKLGMILEGVIAFGCCILS